MAENLISVYALYQAPHFTAFSSNNQIAINTDRINAFTPRPAYLLRELVPGQNQIQYILTFEVSSLQLLDANTLQGVYIEQDGKGVLIDAISVLDFVTNANAGNSPTRKYVGGVPAFTNPTINSYCINRIDDGTGSAVNQLVMDYVGRVIGQTVYSHISNATKYNVTSYTRPIPIGNDIVTVGVCS